MSKVSIKLLLKKGFKCSFFNILTLVIMKKKTIYRTTSYGSLYIDNFDFFSQEKVQKMIKRLMASDLFKSIEQEKLKREKQKAACES